jgi:hypothetical protein
MSLFEAKWFLRKAMFYTHKPAALCPQSEFTRKVSLPLKQSLFPSTAPPIGLSNGRTLYFP